MTGFLPSSPLRLVTTGPDPHTLRVAVHGDLDYSTAGELLTAVAHRLEDQQELRDLHIDCSGMRLCDSSGLSVLLMVRRRADAAAVRLHLDGRGDRLNRMLDITGTLRHLTGEPAEESQHSDQGMS
ncbi:STAS domain-containing protein [Actinomadura viridis]|uniref:Anti-anti-sigma factor n=1 Tax=Actinomadura viridis TaxID=58110 RepID=A0A931DQS0_9ACTN|nr:STAS domain-containing protein [Actinomadura viridis]MBG6092081.1 anti-anti-sigma factor [Actinomadura viridis]